MPSAVWILLTVGLGCTQALQVALLGAMSRVRGPAESAWVSILGTLAGLSLVLAVQGAAGRLPALPPPFNQPAVAGGVALVAGGALAVAVQGLPGSLGAAGFLAAPYLLAASFLSPRLGVGVFMAAIVAGQLVAGVALDHAGAFGATPRPLDLPRLLGVAALVLGVVLIRGRE